MPTPAYYNGEYRPLEGLTVPIMDHGFLFADGVYELIPVYNKRPRCLDDHLERLKNSLAAIHLEGAPEEPVWREICARLIEQSPDECFVYFQITRGVIPEGDPFRKQFLDGPPTVFAMAQPLPKRPESIHAITREDERWGRCHIKSIMLLETVLATQAAVDQQAGEAILHRGDEVMEGATSNVFAVVDGLVRTPKLSPQILPGVTRKLVLRLMRENGMECQESRLSVNELRHAEEVWVTGSTRGVMPVVELDDTPVNNRIIGPTTQRVRSWYREFCNAP
ncbi:MAG: aminotransferase class IV [Gammaproteobacteria bacterium]|nr:aminotransferase class IV [Gammaproteobacteria bacterium]